MDICEPPLTIAYIGNFVPEFSTENEYRDAFERLGHTVIQIQEGSDDTELLDLVANNMVNFVMWTRTRDLMNSDANQWRLIAECRRSDVPIIGVHLDIWHSLQREVQISEPFFHVDILFTADGGHDAEWAAAHIDHHWLLPAISERWLGVGTPRDEFQSEIAFVGSWAGGYHKEAAHRHELVNWLNATYGDRVKFWPKRNEHAIRGFDLNDLYASTRVVVGDSYLSPGGYYCSDRIPETLGRGGILLHPFVRGITDVFHPQSWTAGNWDMLAMAIDAILNWSPEMEVEMRLDYVSRITAAHTYTHRAQEIIRVLKGRGL